MQLNSNEIKKFNRQYMSDYLFIEDAEEFAHSFDDCNALYQWLYDLHQEISIEDLTEVLQLFIDHEKHEQYLTVKKFIALEIDI